MGDRARIPIGIEGGQVRWRLSSGGIPYPSNDWAEWPKGYGAGWSFSRGDVRADVGRLRNPETMLIEWAATVWSGDARADAVPVFTGQDLHDAFELVEDAAR